MDFNRKAVKYPLVRLLLPFIAGIVLQLHYAFDPVYARFLLLLFFLLTFSLIICIRFISAIRYTTRWKEGIIIYLVTFFMGMMITWSHRPPKICSCTKKQETLVFQAKVAGTPEIKPRTVKAVLRVMPFSATNVTADRSSRVLAYFRRDSLSETIHYGDLLTIKTMLAEIPGPKNPGEFDYRKYLFYRKIRYRVFVDEQEWFRTGRDVSGILALAYRVRENVLNIYEKAGIEGQELATLSALTVGWKDELSGDTLHSFIAVGAVHILAISGLHVGIFYLVLSYLLGFLQKYRYGIFIRSVILIMLLWLYAILAGLSPSVVRAAMMFSFLQVGINLQRKTYMLNSLAGSAIMLLIIQPYQVMHVGFQLSYFAVAGIVMFYKKLNSLLVITNFFLKRIWDLFCVSVAAQVATLPVTLFYFNQFSPFFWLSNIILVPMVSFIIYGAILLLLVSPLPGILAFTGTVMSFLLKALLGTVCLFSRLPGAFIGGIHFSFIETIILYALIISLFLYAMKKHPRYVIYSLAVIAVMLAIITGRNYMNHDRLSITFYSVRHGTVIGFARGKEHLVITGVPETGRNDIDYNCKKHWIKNGVYRHTTIIPLDELTTNPYTISDTLVSVLPMNGNVLLNFYGKTLFFYRRNSYIPVAQKPLKIDYLVFCPCHRYEQPKIPAMVSPEQIIAYDHMGVFPDSIRIKGTREYVRLHDLKKKGAMVVNIAR